MMAGLQANFKLTLGRFGSTTDEEKKKIMEDRNAKNTNRATKTAITTFREYLTEKQLKPLEDITNEELPEILNNFYTEAKKTNGTDYCVQSMKCIRAGINRYFKAERGLDIISNTDFVQANEMFRGVNRQKRIQGKGSTKPHAVIEKEDLEKMQNYFQHDVMNAPNPRKLQQCFVFNVIHYFCRRGRENLYNMTADTFAIETDNISGRRYVYQAVDEFDKNHGVDTMTRANEARMYETTGEKSNFQIKCRSRE